MMKERATITVIDNALDPGQAERTVLPLALGLTVREVLPERVTLGRDWIVVENGRVLSPEEWGSRFVTPGTELICYPRMSGAVGRMVAGALLVVIGAMLIVTPAAPFAIPVGLMGIGMLAGGAVDLIMGPPKAAAVPALSSGDQASSATYGFGGVQP